MSEDVYKKALEIIKANCEPEQKIHLNSFHGGINQVHEWRGKLPNTYFSFSMMCKEFNSEQKQGLISVPEHRLLLKTDSPYLSISSDIQINNPRYLGNVTLIVAGLRGIPIGEVLAVSMAGAYFHKHYAYNSGFCEDQRSGIFFVFHCILAGLKKNTLRSEVDNM